MKYKLLFYLFCSLLMACGNFSENQKIEGKRYYPKYAKGFFVVETSNGLELIVRNPSDTNQIISKFIIGRSFDNLNEINTVALYSATHVAFADKLGSINTIVGVSYSNYAHNTMLQEMILKSKTKKLHHSINEGIEVLLDLNPDLIMVSLDELTNSNKATQLGLKVLANTDYLENTPLARMEWIKVFGYLLNKQTKADSIFSNSEKKYLSLVYLTKNVTKKTIFSGLPYRGIWFVPGGNSFKAKFFKDAGGTYVFTNNITGSFQVDFETILEKAVNTNFWEFVSYSDSITKLSLLKDDKRFENFKAIKQNKVIHCNTSKIDYYESGIVEPEIILADLIKILHPELLPEHQNKYYKLLN